MFERQTEFVEAEAMATEQDEWLAAELESLAEDSPVHTMVFSHIPPFIELPDEPKGYFNYDPAVRNVLLEKFKASCVCKWFCGHYHRNAGGWDQNLEVVITSAVGTHLVSSGRDPRGLDGFTFPDSIGEATAGMRLVCVDRGAVGHRWFTLDSVPSAVVPADAAAEWVEMPPPPHPQERAVKRPRL